MSTAQLLALVVTIVGTQFGSLYYLTGRIDRLTDKVDSIDRRLAHLEGQLGVK